MLRFWNTYKTSEVEMDFNIRRYRLPLLQSPPAHSSRLPATSLLSHSTDMRQSTGPSRGRGGRQPPPAGQYGRVLPRQEVDAVMDDVERGEEGEIAPVMAWGQGIAGWGER